MTFWLSLLYILIATPLSWHTVLLGMTLSLCNAILTKYMDYTLTSLEGILDTLFVILERGLSKIRKS